MKDVQSILLIQLNYYIPYGIRPMVFPLLSRHFISLRNAWTDLWVTGLDRQSPLPLPAA